MRTIIRILLLILLLPSVFANQSEDQRRLETLSTEVRCLSCQNQTIAESDAPIANDLKLKIASLIKEKNTDEEIRTYLVNRYGEFILLRPRVLTTTYLLWSFPLLCLTGIIVALGLIIRKRADLTNSSST